MPIASDAAAASGSETRRAMTAAASTRTSTGASTDVPAAGGALPIVDSTPASPASAPAISHTRLVTQRTTMPTAAIADGASDDARIATPVALRRRYAVSSGTAVAATKTVSIAPAPKR